MLYTQEENFNNGIINFFWLFKSQLRLTVSLPRELVTALKLINFL